MSATMPLLRCARSPGLHRGRHGGGGRRRAMGHGERDALVVGGRPGAGHLDGEGGVAADIIGAIKLVGMSQRDGNEVRLANCLTRPERLHGQASGTGSAHHIQATGLPSRDKFGGQALPGSFPEIIPHRLRPSLVSWNFADCAKFCAWSY